MKVKNNIQSIELESLRTGRIVLLATNGAAVLAVILVHTLFLPDLIQDLENGLHIDWYLASVIVKGMQGPPSLIICWSLIAIFIVLCSLSYWFERQKVQVWLNAIFLTLTLLYLIFLIAALREDRWTCMS